MSLPPSSNRQHRLVLAHALLFVPQDLSLHPIFKLDVVVGTIAPYAAPSRLQTDPTNVFVDPAPSNDHDHAISQRHSSSTIAFGASHSKMAILSIPSSGLSLSSKDQSGLKDSPQQVIRLDLIESKTKEILAALKSKSKVVLQTGKQAALQYGDKKLVLQASSDSFPSDLYVKHKDNEKEVYFSGKLSHILEIQKAREATEKADEALATLQNSLKAMKEQSASKQTSIVQSTDDLKLLNRKDHKPSLLLGAGFRKDHLLGGVSRSTPSTPFMSASRSPNHGPTSAPLQPGGFGPSNKDRVRLEAIKIPLIHLLAIRPLSAKMIVEKLRAPKEDCDRLLAKYAQDSVRNVGKKELKEKTYKELDVWKFPYQNEDDRKAAIDRAIQAFDRTRIDKNGALWQMLLAPSERGKGKILSRLNLNRGVASQHLKPERVDSKGETSDIEGSKSPQKRPMGLKKAPEKKSSTDSASKPKQKALSPIVEKKRETSSIRAAKPGGKFKSSERIEDSDEEAEDADVIPAKSKATVKKQTHSSTPLHSPQRRTLSPKKQLHKSTLSSSSGSDSSDNQTSNHSLKAPTKEQTPGHSTRPRHGSSPQKPSPLGSSPPANSTDFDSSSSSKQSQSSAPSSPPSSTDMPIAKQKYSPIIKETNRDVSRGRATLKRKSDDMEPESPAKRHQPNGVSTDKLSNGVKRSMERPKPERKATDSDTSTASEKGPPAREEVVDEAKRFQLYYKKYKDLHEKLNSKPEKERDPRDMDALLSMHSRLKEMKAEIWNNWDKVEKTVST